MSDELPKKVLSVPPPPTDEIDDEWGNKGSDAKAPKTATAAAEAGEAVETKPTSEAAAKKLSAETAAAAETATPPGTPESSIEEEDDEDEEEDDEDEEEDEDDAHPSVHSAAPVTRTSRPPTAAADDWLPDWAPWAVLGAIILVGLLGGVGAFNKKGDAQAQGEDKPATGTTAAAAKPGGAALDANASIEASHFLVQYQGSMRAPATITRTKEEAKKRAEEGLAKVKKGEDFAKVVADYSDEPGAGARGGKLGDFTRDRMIKPFSDAAFALKVNEVSGVVETPFGFHVIKRTK